MLDPQRLGIQVPDLAEALTLTYADTRSGVDVQVRDHVHSEICFIPRASLEAMVVAHKSASALEREITDYVLAYESTRCSAWNRQAPLVGFLVFKQSAHLLAK